MPKLCANPYDTPANWFYFETLVEYRNKQANHVNRYGQPVEEYEFIFIDGDELESSLFEALSVDGGNLDKYFEVLERDEEDQVKLCLLLGENFCSNLDDALDKLDDFCLQETDENREEDAFAEYAERLTRECGDIPSHLDSYIDWERMGRDMGLNGEIGFFECNGQAYTYNPQEI